MAKITGKTFNLLPCTPISMSILDEFLFFGLRLKTIKWIEENEVNDVKTSYKVKEFFWITHKGVEHKYKFHNTGLNNDDITTLLVLLRMS